MRSELFEAMTQCIIDGELDDAKTLAQQSIAEGIDLLESINKGFILGVDYVGQQFSMGEAFLPELIIAGEAMKSALSVLEPEMAKSGTQLSVLGKVV